jgi:hypothetical protein
MYIQSWLYLVFSVVIVYTITLHSMLIIVIHVWHGSTIIFYDHDVRDRRGRDHMIVDVQLPMQSVPVTIEGVSS